MSIYETARNGFAIIGLLTTSGLLGLIGWHAVVAIRRFRANRAVRENERARARVQPARLTDELDVGYESLGVVPIREQEP